MANGIEFRLFVSSTFADTTVERNALQKHVFPKLQQLCAGRGARFHAIDLRWGVSEEAALDQQTVNICLDEVRRCLATGSAPNFLILLGNRYGWLPPPAQIPASEFSRLLDRVDKASQRKRLLKWYALDKNAVPAEYQLKAREGKYREPTTWSREEARLRQTLVTAATCMRLPAVRRRCFADSATAQEINVGVLDPGNTRALCYFRRIPNIERLQALGPYLDQNIRGQWDRESAKRLDDLKHRLRKLLPSENIHEFDAKWSVSQKRVTRGHIQSFCKRVEADLKRMILAELERAEEISELQREIQAHTDFGRQRSLNFVGRKDIVHAIEAYVKGDGNRPLVVYGPSGCGKTALIAHCAERLSSTGSDIGGVIVRRFIGATAAASELRDLLHNMCLENRQRYGQEPTPSVDDLAVVADEFADTLRLATRRSPLILFLDALDQLSQNDDAHSLKWLPGKLPPHVRVIVSALQRDDLAGRCLRVLSERGEPDDLLRVPELDMLDGRRLLGAWLQDASRKLQKEQTDYILKKLVACPTPLYLRLAFEEARQWPSGATDGHLPEISESVEGIVNDFLSRLEQPEHHSRKLVQKTLGYLGASRNGLAEDELLEILSRIDPDVLPDFRKASPKSPATDRLPFVIWSRLRADLSPYLSVRRADQTKLLSFYHRQIGEEIQTRVFGDGMKGRLHRRLVEFFGEQDNNYDSGTLADHPNYRKASELVFHQMEGGLWPQVQQTLSDLTFLQAKCAAGMVGDLMADFDKVETAKTVPETVHDLLRPFARFIRESAHALARWPAALIGNAYNHQAGGPVADAARVILTNRGAATFYLKCIQRVSHSQSLRVQTLAAHAGGVMGVVCLGDGIHALSAGVDGRLKLWDLNTGQCIRTLERHGGRVYAFDVTPDGRYVVSAGSDYLLKFWDLRTGYCLASKRAHKNWISALAITPDGKQVITGAGPATFKYWEIPSGQRIRVSGDEPKTASATRVLISPGAGYGLAGLLPTLLNLNTNQNVRRLIHDGRSWCLEVTSDLSRAITGDEFDFDFDTGDGAVSVWDLGITDPPLILRGKEKRINAIALFANERLIVTGSEDGIVSLWNLQSAKCEKSFIAHDKNIEGIAIHPDGQKVLTASRDGTVKVWNLAHHGPSEFADETPGRADLMTVSSMGRRAAIMVEEKRVKVFDTRTLAILEEHEVGGWSYGGVALCDDESTFVGNYGYVERLSSREDKRRWRWKIKDVHSCYTAVCVSNDERWLIAGTSDADLAAWRLDNGKRCWIQKTGAKKKPETLAINISSQTSRLLVAGAYGSLTLRDLESGKTIRRLLGHRGRVHDAVFTPNGARAVSVGEDRLIRIWDLTTFECTDILEGHDATIRCVAISPDGTFAATGGEDDTLQVWNLGTAKPVACYFAGSDIRGCAFTGIREIIAVERLGVRLWFKLVSR
jgi:WD40 repeat protein